VGSSIQRGSISALVVCLVISAIAVVGISYDGGRVVSSYVELSDIAQNAARIGAQHVVGIREGEPRVSRSASVDAMEGFLRGERVTGYFTVSSRSITVKVTRNVPMRVLGVVGVHWRTITVTRSAFLSDS
jgi:hypothetical protein